MPNSLITDGIKVTSEVFYQQDYSNPIQGEFMFAYRITIENISRNRVQLKSRHWHIFDSDGTYRIVDGEGVVGMHPIIAPNEEYQYVSGCNLHTEIGHMFGSYIFSNLDTKEDFEVSIPEFQMVAPFKLN